MLEWQTASERNHAGFAIERSTDGKMFAKVGWVGALANGRGGAYSYYDADFSGRAYYRLRQIDNDGAFEFSKTVYLTRNAGPGKPVLSPNPAVGALTLDWAGHETETVALTLTTADGKQILANHGSVLQLAQTLTDVLAGQPQGMYVVRLQTADETHTLRIVR
jgi:hypothetical protein